MKNLIAFLLITTLSYSQTNLKIDIAFDFLKNFNNVRDLTIDQNQNEVYFTIQSPNEQVSKIAFSKKQTTTGQSLNLFLFQVLLEI